MNVRELAHNLKLSFIELFVICADSMFLWIASRRKNDEKLVVIVRLDAIGDFVLWLESARQLTEYYQERGYKVVLLGNDAWTKLADKQKIFDAIVSIHVKSLARNLPYRYRTLRQVNRLGAAVVLHPTFSREIRNGDSVVRALGAREKVGWRGDCLNTSRIGKAFGDRWYSRLLPNVSNTMHELERNAEFVYQLTGDRRSAAVGRLRGSRASKSPLGAGSGYVVVVPGASWSGKQWNLECFGLLIDRVWEQMGLETVVCGGPADVTLGGQLSGGRVYVKDFTGRTDIVRLAELISGATLVVSNDTAAAHIAAASGVSVVTIAGGGHYGRFFPYPSGGSYEGIVETIAHKMPCFGCDWRCVYPHGANEPVLCIRNISVDEVWERVKALLGDKRPQAGGASKSVGSQ